MRPPKPVSSCRPMSIHSSESMRGAVTIMSSSNCSLASEDSASGSGCGPTFQRAVRMGMTIFLFGHLIEIGGGLTTSPLPHHRTFGSRIRRFGRFSMLAHAQALACGSPRQRNTRSGKLPY